MARIIDGDVHVKFLLVVDQNELMSNDGRAVCELFYKFFSWFKIDYCSEDIRKTLYSAVGLVITRAREDVDNFTHL